MNDFLLTLSSCKDYSFAQVLNTLPKAECPAPDSRGFFTSIVFNGRVVGNDTIPEKSGKVASRLLAVLKYSVTLSTRVQFNKTKRRPIMADNTKDASASRKSRKKSAPVLASTLFIDQKRREEYRLRQWQDDINKFIEPLTTEEIKLLSRYTKLLVKKPGLVRRKPKSSEVISFPTQDKRITAQEDE
jgi:hypothetical protein